MSTEPEKKSKDPMKTAIVVYAINALLNTVVPLVVFLIVGAIIVSNIKGALDTNVEAADVAEILAMAESIAAEEAGQDSLANFHQMYNADEEEYGKAPLDSMYRIEFIDVGHGDCTLLTGDGQTMLIDCGDVNDGGKIAKHLLGLGIDSIQVLVLTNEQAEHIGGLSSLIETIHVETVYCKNASTENEALQGCFKMMRDAGTEIIEVVPGISWNIAAAQCSVLSCTDNVIVRFSVQNISTLVLSDATPEEELALLELDADISATFLRAARHGAENSMCDDMTREISPEYIFVSCDESIEEPDVKALVRMYKRATTARTDMDDTICVYTDGENYRWGSEKTNCDG